MLTPPWATGRAALSVVLTGVPAESTSDTTSSTKTERPCTAEGDERSKRGPPVAVTSGRLTETNRSAKETAAPGMHMAVAGPHACMRRAVKSAATERAQELVQLAVALEAPMPTRTELAGMRPVLALGVKASLRANDTAAYWDLLFGSAESITCKQSTRRWRW